MPCHKLVCGVLELDPGLCLHAGPERVFYLLHFGHQVGDLDQFVLGIAAGDDHVLALRLVLQDFDDLVERMEDDEETDEIIEAINERDPNWLVRWHDDAGPEMMQHNASEAPSFMFFDDPKVGKNGWWVHFTNDARDIERSGFEYGESDPLQLGLTTWKDKEAKRGPGYVFAFDPRDAVRRNFAYGATGKYGSEAVVFRADAVVAYHHGDEEDQAISWGPEAEDIHAVYFSADEDRHPPGLSGKRPPRNGIAGTYDEYEDVTFFSDLPTLVAYLDAGRRKNR